MENYTALIGLATTVIGAGIGYYLKYFLDKQKELTSEVTKERRVMYQQFVNIFLDIIYETKNGGTSDFKKQLNEMQQFFKKNTVYASPKVIKSIAELFQILYATQAGQENAKVIFTSFTKAVKAMRSDLGLSNKGLGKNGEILIKPMFTDWSLMVD